MKNWTPAGWRSCPVAQTPLYPNRELLAQSEQRLKTYPSLIFEAEVDQLRERLAAVGRGEAFLLQGGDCAESFDDFRLETIRDNLRILLQMAIVLTFGSKRPILKIGRVAGQYAKPRSNDQESRAGVSLPAYRGDIINGHEFTLAARTPIPERMEKAYFHAAATINLLRSLTTGGFADLERIHAWNLDFMRQSQFQAKYDEVAERLNESLAFMKAAGVGRAKLETTEFYTSHEALLLNYEEALTRPREDGRGYYAGSAHMVWIGERTRQLDGAHIEFARGVCNPLGLKCGPETSAEVLLRLSEKLNPTNEMGRLTVIPRMGAGVIDDVLPKLVRRMRGEGRNLVWCCDPMHGNTYTTASGFKTRSFANILSEANSFFAIHEAEGSVAGGVHFELTGRNVTECTGGNQNIHDEHLSEDQYESRCDPRLNASQALELALPFSEGARVQAMSRILCLPPTAQTESLWQRDAGDL